MNTIKITKQKYYLKRDDGKYFNGSRQHKCMFDDKPINELSYSYAMQVCKQWNKVNAEQVRLISVQEYNDEINLEES